MKNRLSPTTTHYVIKSIFWVDISLLLCHLFYAGLFYFIKADVMFVFNCFSVLLYFCNAFALKKAKPEKQELVSRIIVIMAYVEMYLYMVLATICLGYAFGFLQYSFGLVTTVIFSAYFIGRGVIISKGAGISSAVIMLTYLSLWIWTFGHAPVYETDEVLGQLMFIINSVITLGINYIYTQVFLAAVFRQEDSLQSIADYDTLTGLRNRRAMLRVFDEFREKCDKKKKLLCVALIDIDFFKKVNDTYGHDAGDEVLRKLADFLLSRESELKTFRCARWGGEEFVLLYMGERDAQDKIVAELEHIRDAVSKLEVPFDEQVIRFTLTIGAAFYDGSQDAQMLINEADKMLYKGKEASRNCVVYQ